jgi:hypothetical protein
VKIARPSAHFAFFTEINHFSQNILTHRPVILRVKAPRFILKVIAANLCEEWPFSSKST